MVKPVRWVDEEVSIAAGGYDQILEVGPGDVLTGLWRSYCKSHEEITLDCVPAGTAEQIAANLRAQGFAVADDIIILSEHIKQVGSHSVKLRYSENLIANVKVTVVAEQQEVDAENTDKPASDTEK